MVFPQTVKRVRAEFKSYLQDIRPALAESTIDMYASDALLAANNDIGISLWSCLVDEESLVRAKSAIEIYLAKDIGSDRAGERAVSYLNSMRYLKRFMDEKYGGVEQCIGKEMYAERDMYRIIKRVYDGEITNATGLEMLLRDFPAYSDATLRFCMNMFKAMREGKAFTRGIRSEFTLYFVQQMAEDYGNDAIRNALRSIYLYIQYAYEQGGQKSSGLRNRCQEISQKENVGIDFGEGMFRGITPKNNADETLIPAVAKQKYWLYSAGRGSANWDEDYALGIMAIGWDEIGDLSIYDSKEAMKTAMRTTINPSWSFMNDAHATWQFVNEIQVGDIIYVKRGLTQFVGRGIVVSDYIYDPTRERYKNTRRVRWTHCGEWDHPEQSALKTLTEITRYTDYRNGVEAIFTTIDDDEDDSPTRSVDTYTESDFLHDVYMDSVSYQALKTLLLWKKNIILQGAPGVGKTFAAKRLAYSIMGEKNDDRVMMVQFHQSYSYEDFIMGFRPSGTGFEAKVGPFYAFCETARIDSDNPYFFIIDEINRGNLSKIFGELLMLLENDKRGVELRLLYSNEQFSIPSNIYVIGMMNTADRSLAMLDYALRRRFGFFTLRPAFQSEGFMAYQSGKANSKLDRLVAVVQQLNEAISKDETLGEGFCIGHSYFCSREIVSDSLMNSIVEYELIPLINEYWFDEPLKAQSWSTALRGAVR